MDNQGYCVRVQALDGYGDRLPMLTACADYSAIVAVKHKGNKGENPHFHLVIRTQIRDQAFRVRLRKIFDQGKGNGHMSIIPWDGDIKAVSYLFHEDPNTTLLIKHNVEDTYIERAKALNAEISQAVQASKDKASWKLEPIVLDQARSRRFSVPDSEAAARWIGQQIILTALRTGKYVPQPWLIRAMTQRIQFTLLGGDVEREEEFAMRLSEQIFYRP